MHRRRLQLAITILAGGLSAARPAGAQLLPPAAKAARVEIIQGPALELALEHLAIIRWTTHNPGGSDVHLGVVYYGTDPSNLDQRAESPVRLNRGHAETVFRVRLTGLKPRTTYHYRVTSMESGGQGDGEASPVARFTTPGPGERIIASPPRSPVARVRSGTGGGRW